MLILILYLNEDPIDLIKTRRSVRSFKQEEISLDILKDIIDAARLAPSPHNLQPWEFIIVKEKENRDTVFKHISWLSEPKKELRPTAYIMVLTEVKNLKNVSITASIGASIQNILISAWYYGIGSCWIGSIKKKDELKKFFNIPESLSIFAIIALGYPADIPETIDSDSILKPFIKDGKLIVPKKKLEKILHIF